MQVYHTIIHHVYQTEQDEVGARLSPQILENTVEMQDLVIEINRIYTHKPNKSYANFESNESVVEKELKAWLTHKEDQEAFTKLSQHLTRHFRDEIKDFTLPKNGFLLFTFYRYLEQDFLLMVFLPIKEGVVIQDDLSVQRISQLDMSKFQLGLQLNLNKYNQLQIGEHAISFLRSGTGKQIARFFEAYLGCEEDEELKQHTASLVQAVNRMMQEKDVEEDLAYQAKQEVVEYCTERWRQGEKAQLHEVEKKVVGLGAPSIRAFSEEQNIELPEHFPADQKSLRQLVKFQGQGGGVSVSFEQKYLGKSIQYNVERDELTIHGLPPNLREQLRRFYGENN